MKKKNKSIILFSLLVVLLPFTYQYKGIGAISFGELLLLPFMVIYLIIIIVTKRGKVDKRLLLFYVICVLLTFVSFNELYFSVHNFLTVFARLVFYGVLIYVSRYYFDYFSIRKFYWLFTSLICFYAILQYAIKGFFGVVLPNSINPDWVFDSEIRASNGYWYRPSGLFLEPSYLALFSLPCLADCIITKKYKLWFVCGILVVGSYLVSSSSAGFIGAIIIFIMSVFFSDKNKNIVNKFLWVFVVLAFAVLIYISGAADLSISRIQKGGSFESRILNGFFLFAKIGTWKQILGVGINNISNYIDYYNISSGLKTYGLESYSSSVSGLLNSCGAIGFLFFLFFVLGYFKRIKDPISKCMFVLFLYAFCVEAILFTYRFGFYLILLNSFCFFICNESKRTHDKEVKHESINHSGSLFSIR